MSSNQTEVLVVGAGPVGMFTALLLTQNGIRTRIIDQEPRPAGHSYACALHPKSLKLLGRAGLADEVIKHGHRINKIAFYAGGTRRGELKLSELSTEFPFVLVVDQGRLEDMLDQKLRETGKVEVEWSHRLADMVVSDAGVTANLERLASTGKGYAVPDFGVSVAKTMETRAEFVIGTDGNHSTVRRRLELGYEQAGECEAFEVHEVTTEGGIGDEVQVVLDRSLTSVMWPFAENRCRWSFQLPLLDGTDEFPDKDRSRLVVGREGDQMANLQRLLRERAPWFHEKIRDAGWSTHIQFEHRLVNRFGKGRVWLAGDAAHQTGPVGVQSMNTGFAEGADLVTALRKILRDRAPGNLLKEYGEHHRAEWRQLLGLDAGPRPTSTAGAWASANCARIFNCVPASGGDMAALLGQLGLEFKPAANGAG